MSDVSIILPALEVNEYLFLTLESILKVDYRNLEILIVHDRQDEHQDDFLDFPERFIEAGHELLVAHSPTGGLVSALNFGLNLSKREFICRIDSDDFMLPERIKMQVDYLKENPKVAVVGGQIRYMDSIGNVKNKSSHYPIDPDSTRKYFEKGCFLAHPAALFRRAEISALGGYRPFFKSAEDLDLWLRVLEVRDISNLNENVIIYREHSGQMSSRHSEVNLYTRIAYRSSQLRKSGVLQDLPENLNHVEKWLTNTSSTTIFRKRLNEMFAIRYLKLTSETLAKLKFTRFQRKYFRFFGLLFFAGLIMPRKLFRESVSFVKFRSKDNL